MSLCGLPAFAGNVDKIYSVTADQIIAHATAKPGRKVIFIYASWCPYCRENMPAMIDLETASAGSVFAVSVDENPVALGQYLNSLPSVPFHALRLKNTNSSEIENAFGLAARNGVPYKILLDENNKPYRAGNFTPEYVAEYLLGKE